MTPPTSASGVRGSWDSISKGAALQCIEAATLGMPFEVWKTRMGRYREESTAQAFAEIYRRGGVSAYWQGLNAKLIESATKGAVLLYSKEVIFDSLKNMGFSEVSSGFIAGAGGGICQTVVLGPCTFVVTALVTGRKIPSVAATAAATTAIAAKNNTCGKGSSSALQALVHVWKMRGFRGFYSGGTAIAFRQATNWASRQGFTEFIRDFLKKRSESHSLTKSQEIFAGIAGGALSTWNQPFEVARIHMQAAANEGKPQQNLMSTFRCIVNENGWMALYKGLIPRIGLGVWQTLFMVTGAKMLRESFSL